MNEKLQIEFRKKLHEQYLEGAFEFFSNYDLLGEKNASYIKQREDYEKRIKEAQNRIKATSDYDLRKSLQEDVKNYKQALDATKMVGEKTEKEAGQWREKAITYMERAEHVLKFKLNTPEQIAEAKNGLKVESTTTDSL